MDWRYTAASGSPASREYELTERTVASHAETVNYLEIVVPMGSDGFTMLSQDFKRSYGLFCVFTASSRTPLHRV